MKRMLGAALAAVMTLALFGCANRGGGSEPTPAPTPTAQATPTPEPTPTPTPTPAYTGNPLTGTDEDCTGKRPVAVQLRTEEKSRPLWGVADADVLIEGVTEGKYAGLMALYADRSRIEKVGPVAPGRDLMLQFALPLNAVPVHIGKNIYASNLLNALGYQDLDGYHIGTAGFAYDEGRKEAGFNEEACWYTTGTLIGEGLANYGASTDGQTIPLFRFGDRSAPAAQNGRDLFITFSDRDTEELVYDPESGLYQKKNADGSPMMDVSVGRQAAFTNVFVLYASSGVKDDGYTRQYDLSGGTGIYLTGGGWEQIRWEKGDATAPLKLYDASDRELTVSRGKSFIAVWGGYYGQGLRLLAEDGTEQTLPEKPALLESGIPDDVAAGAEEAYRQQQEAIAASEAALAEDQAAEGEEGSLDAVLGGTDSPEG
ncbi:MAG: DUF3048 domain-containing protein [Gemmiger sp.]